MFGNFLKQDAQINSEQRPNFVNTYAKPLRIVISKPTKGQNLSPPPPRQGIGLKGLSHLEKLSNIPKLYAKMLRAFY